MKNDLIERYLYAVTRRMNPKIREDVKKELSGLIDDMLMERCSEKSPEEKDVRIVLTELGTPQELYAKYADDADQCMIGQPYYSTYKYVLKIALGAVAVGLTIACVILQFLNPQNWNAAVEQWIEYVSDGLVNAFALITFLFAFYQRKGIKTESYNLDDLPPVPKKKQEVSRGECIFSIVFSVILMVLLLATPQYLVGYWSSESGIAIPLFSTVVMRNSWYLVLIFGVADITRSVYRLLEGQFNRKVLTVTLVTNVICAAAVTLWLSNPGLINPDFVTHVQSALADENATIQNIFTNFDSFILVVIMLALVLDTIEATVKTFKK